ncbi:SagB family peptide dehydrogenase [Marininema halotolerans]|uniref:SagB-type dehydrogenase domain-containing protein n=1 Tax=Marininema halotolerans TaxID=1155944 RepID=A0A1I6QL19_9BACL|nr:SagB family peptide dehydrogenase [Marininema halotolerans]SFS53131.1 SagB-type dehydrogenase domain-containing protein [Marininema halotolerans]
MHLRQFIHDLHYDVEKVLPSDWEIDWANAPRPYKLYHEQPEVDLPGNVPLTLEEAPTHSLTELQRFSYFLWYVYGLNHCIETPDFMGGSPVLRRYVPSGGALYPTELYTYLKIEGLEEGIYHYNVAHHRLVLLRKGNYDALLMQMLGGRCNVKECSGVILVSTMFWKNFFKYHNFSYRLQGLDAGVVIGQLNEVAERLSYSTAVYYCFLDRGVNRLFGIHEEEESAYALLPLYQSTLKEEGRIKDDPSATSDQLCQQIPELSLKTSSPEKKFGEYPMLIAMNKAAMLDSSRDFPRPEQEKNGKRTRNGGEGGEEKSSRILFSEKKPLIYDFVKVCRQRFSPGMDFVLDKVEPEHLGQLCKEVAPLLGDHNGEGGRKLWEDVDQPLFLYISLYGVKGIPNGAYFYDGDHHGLKQLRTGDQRLWLQQGMTLHNVNLTQVPLCFHIAGMKDFGHDRLGERGYRMNQMKAGIIVQRLLLTATALGWAGHPLLGFNSSLCDSLYNLSTCDQTCFIQIPVGPYRSRAQLIGSIYG